MTDIQKDSAAWNDRMFVKLPTPYDDLAGWVQRLRARAVRSWALIRPEDSVLEVGCEAGQLLQRMPDCRRLVGLDISEKALEVARRRFKRAGRNAEFVQADATLPLPFAPGEFSVIICSEMLEHADDPRAAMEAIHRVALAETRVIVTVPNERPKLVIKKWMLKTGLLRLLMPRVEVGRSEWHLHDFSMEKLREVAQGLFEIQGTKTVLGMHIVARMRKI